MNNRTGWMHEQRLESKLVQIQLSQYLTIIVSLSITAPVSRRYKWFAWKIRVLRMTSQDHVQYTGAIWKIGIWAISWRAWLLQMHTWEIRPSRLNDLDDQVSREDLVGQPLTSNRSPVWRWPGLSGGSYSPWELRYEGAMTQLPLDCNLLTINSMLSIYITAPATNE